MGFKPVNFPVKTNPLILAGRNAPEHPGVVVKFAMTHLPTCLIGYLQWFFWGVPEIPHPKYPCDGENE